MTEQNPLVSIIVRTKDRPRLLKRALQSINRQTYRPIEAVLVNDGGCDLDVEELKDLLGNVALDYKRLEKNRGRAHAGNVGIGGAKGKYIGFLDDDDEFYQEHVQTLVSFLEHNDYKIAYTDVEMIRCDFSPEEGTAVDLDRSVFSEDFSYGNLFLGNYIPFNSILIESEALRSAGGLDEDFELYEDWDLLIRIGNKYPFYHLRKLTARYNQWSGDLQINRSDDWQMQSVHAKVIAKNLDKINPSIILQWKLERERAIAGIAKAVNERDRATAEMGKEISERDRAIAELGKAVSERDSRIGQLADSCLEKNELIVKRDGLIEERDVLISGMETLTAELKESLNEKVESIARIERLARQSGEFAFRLESELRDLEKMNHEKEARIVELHGILAAVQGTVGWRTLENIRGVRNTVLPSNSRRRKVYDLAVKSLRTIKRDGMKTFLGKAGKKLRGSNFGIVDSYKTVASLSFREDPGLEHFPSKRKFGVLFVKCEWAGITNHYRVENMAEYLKIGDTFAEILDLECLPKNVPHAYTFDLVIIHRIPMNPLLQEFIKACKKYDIVVIFDIDDYLFEPSVIHLIEWVKHTDATKRDQLIEHMTQCRQTLEACDYFFAPTDFLARKGADLGKKAFVLRNGFSLELYGSFLKAMEVKTLTKRGDILRIGYFSGTNTHQKDFEFISGAILRILREYDNVNLYICGLLELGRGFELFSERVERSPLVPLEKLAEEVSRCDINIAPLEPENVFCEAKSELKYMYAGMMKIPTVASPADAFRYAIKDGENGFLASTAEEWYQCLKTLVEDSSLRVEMGKQAFAHVVNSYAPEALAHTVQDAYERIIADARKKNNIPEQSISVGIIVSDFVDNIAEYSHLFDIADVFSSRGHHVKFYFYGRSDEDSAASPSPLQKPGYVIVQGTDNMISADALICTDPCNSSVSSYQNRDLAANLVYLPPQRKSEDIPYQWATLFRVVPDSLRPADIVNYIESIVWKTANLARS
jgi:glycosyltransferase involved in cell wall biosynthesis